MAEDITNNSDIMATSAVRTLYRRQQAEEQVERHRDQQGREVNKRYSDLKNELDNSTPLQLMLERIRKLDNQLDEQCLTDKSLTERGKLDIINCRTTLKYIQGIYSEIKIKGTIAENEIEKRLDALKKDLSIKQV